MTTLHEIALHYRAEEGGRTLAIVAVTKDGVRISYLRSHSVELAAADLKDLSRQIDQDADRVRGLLR